MRRVRLKLQEQTAVYHCYSHLVCGLAPLTEVHKDHFRQLLRRQARFCGLDVITHSEMDTHVHLEVRVPHGPPPDDRELFRRARALYGKHHHQTRRLRDFLTKTGSIPADLRAKLLPRMGDISPFMKELKQGFTRWFNEQTGRFGTLWAERFGSVVVEDAPSAVGTMAAYTDLNAVRAGVVEDPKDYRFCGYAEAVAGNRQAQAGLMSFLPPGTWEEAGAVYRQKLFLQAGVAGGAGKALLSREQILEVVRQGGRISPAEALRLKIRYFTHGWAMGSAAFIESLFLRFREYFSRRRTTGPRPLRGLPFPDLYCLQDIRQDPLS